MNTEHIITYNSREFREWMKHFRKKDVAENIILVYAGENTQDRNHAIEDLKREFHVKTLEIDLASVITLSEQDSFTNTDEMIQTLDTDAGLIIFRNAGVLNGPYTGFTASAVTYGTPQEKYFLKEIKIIPAVIVIELTSTDQLDRRLQNSADHIITFNPPSSFIEKLFWNLKHIHVHGSRFLYPRKV